MVLPPPVPPPEQPEEFLTFTIDEPTQTRRYRTRPVTWVGVQVKRPVWLIPAVLLCIGAAALAWAYSTGALNRAINQREVVLSPDRAAVYEFLSLEYGSNEWKIKKWHKDRWGYKLIFRRTEEGTSDSPPIWFETERDAKQFIEDLFDKIQNKTGYTITRQNITTVQTEVYTVLLGSRGWRNQTRTFCVDRGEAEEVKLYDSSGAMRQVERAVILRGLNVP